MAQKLFACDQVTFTRKAAEALTAYKFVKPNATDTANVDLCDTAGERALGILDSDWSSGDEAVKVIYGGIAYCMAGGAVAVGDYIAVDASGRGVKASGVQQADYIVGVAETAAAAAGALFSIRLFEASQQGSITSIGVGRKLLSIPIAVVAATTENDTGYDLPAKAIVKGVWVNMTTAPTAGTTKLIDVGTDGTGSNDPDGWLDGVSIASTGLAKGTLVSTGQTLGVLLRVDEDGSGAVVPEPDIASGGESITYSYSAADIAGQAGNIIIDYIEVK